MTTATATVTTWTARWLVLAIFCVGGGACSGDDDDDDDTGAGGTITGVTAGEGLTGGGTTGGVSLAVDFTKVARAGQSVAFSSLTGIPNAATNGAKCPVGQKVTGIDVSTGMVTCEDDATGGGGGSQWTTVADGQIRFDGDVGIGQSPNGALAIDRENGQIFVHDREGGNGASLILDDADSSAPANIILQRAGGSMAEVTIFLGSDNALVYQTASAPHRFKYTASDEAMRISGAGNVGIHNTTPSDLLVVGAGAHCDGNQWINASSRTMKDGIRDFAADDYARVRRWLDETQVVWYRYRSTGDARDRVGLIAEDVPDVLATPDRKGISTADAIGFLTAATKDVAAENDRLRKENRELADRLAAMEKRLTRLEKR